MNSEWRKSSHSNSSGGNCVEVGAAGAVLIRDTTDNGHGPVLRISAETWRAFTAALHADAAPN